MNKIKVEQAAELKARLRRAEGPGWHPLAVDAVNIAEDAIAALAATEAATASLLERIAEHAAGFENAWREGWALCKASLAADTAHVLTDDVEADAWADSNTRAWMHGNRILSARYLGWNLAHIANDLIDRAYPGFCTLSDREPKE